MGRYPRAIVISFLFVALVFSSGPGKARYDALASSPAAASLAPETALGAGFTYQGQLRKNGTSMTASCSFTFGLWDAAGTGSPPAGGNQVGSNQVIAGVSVVNGLFTVILNQNGEFGASAFNGDARWLQISVTCPGDGNATTLSPRQPITASPYALTSPGSPYQNVIIVAKSGGDYASIQAALDSILDAGPNHPYLVWVAPGVYTEMVTMKPYIDIEGAGQNMTRITFSGSGSDASATVLTASNAELRSLSVENTGGNVYAIAILNDGTSPSLKDIKAVASAGSNLTVAVFVENSASPVISRSTLITEGGGSNHYTLYSRGSAFYTVYDADISAYGGSNLNYGIISTVASTTNVHRSVIWGTSSSVHMLNSTGRIANTQLIGGVSTGGTSFLVCVGAYDQSFVALGIDCQ